MRKWREAMDLRPRWAELATTVRQATITTLDRIITTTSRRCNAIELRVVHLSRGGQSALCRCTRCSSWSRQGRHPATIQQTSAISVIPRMSPVEPQMPVVTPLVSQAQYRTNTQSEEMATSYKPHLQPSTSSRTPAVCGRIITSHHLHQLRSTQRARKRITIVRARWPQVTPSGSRNTSTRQWVDKW